MNKSQLIVVSDFFVEDLIGGAELTLEAILKACPYSYKKIRSANLTEEFIDQNKDSHWLLVNFTGASKTCIIDIATKTSGFSIIECDYKYCKYRSSHLHALSEPGRQCDCNLTEHGRFILGLFNRAKKVFFMSNGQLNEYKRLFPIMNQMTQNKLIVHGSTFDNKTIEQLKQLYQKRKQDNGKWAILSGGSWIKNQKSTEEYCKTNNLEYELIGKLKPEDFINKLSEFHGLVFHSLGFDTNPRLTIEAKLLGLEVDINDLVQQKYDDWYNLPVEQLYAYLELLPNRFWENFVL
jgi:hypothetical protein